MGELGAFQFDIVLIIIDVTADVIGNAEHAVDYVFRECFLMRSLSAS
jgi:hypothetical protein